MPARTVPPRTVTITFEQRPGKPFPCHHVDCKACGYTYPAAVKVDAAEKAGIHRRNCPSLGGA